MRAIVDMVFERTYPPHDRGDPETYAEHRGRFLAIDPVCYAHANAMLAQVALEHAKSVGASTAIVCVA